jgi:hypothetical protein
MTHTLHRRGDRENLSGDYVVFTMSAKGFNEKGGGEKMKKFLEIILRHDPVTFGDGITGNSKVRTREEIQGNIDDVSVVHGVFTDPAVVANVLRDLKKAEIGTSIIVSGIHDETEKCCRAAGLRKHTIEHSMGYFGQVKRLPDHEFMELTSMCGHAMVPANLVERMLREIKRGKKTCREAAVELTRPCHCGVYNPVRAEKLLKRLVPLMVLDE